MQPSPSPEEAVWQVDAAATDCNVCGVRFTLFLRKHHCRRCGRIVCDACSQGRAEAVDMASKPKKLAERERDGLFRACDDCMAVRRRGGSEQHEPEFMRNVDSLLREITGRAGSQTPPLSDPIPVSKASSAAVARPASPQPQPTPNSMPRLSSSGPSAPSPSLPDGQSALRQFLAGSGSAFATVGSSASSAVRFNFDNYERLASFPTHPVAVLLRWIDVATSELHTCDVLTVHAGGGGGGGGGWQAGTQRQQQTHAQAHAHHQHQQHQQLQQQETCLQNEDVLSAVRRSMKLSDDEHLRVLAKTGPPRLTASNPTVDMRPAFWSTKGVVDPGWCFVVKSESRIALDLVLNSSVSVDIALWFQ